MTTTSKIKNFVKEVTARLKQDENGVVVLKNQRKADAALNSQISALKNREVDLEATLEDAEEVLSAAKYPTTLITSSQGYINAINEANTKVENAKVALETVRTSIKFYEQVQQDNNQEVEA